SLRSRGHVRGRRARRGPAGATRTRPVRRSGGAQGWSGGERRAAVMAGRIAVAFDLDGTLVDLEAFHHDAMLRAAREVGVELTWEEALARLPHFIGGPDRRLAAEVAALSPAGAAPDKVLAAKQRYFSSLLTAAPRVVPRPGAGEVLDRLVRRGVPVAVRSEERRVGKGCRTGGGRHR